MHTLVPRDRFFWLCHGAALTVWAVVQGVATYAWAEHRLFNLAGSLMWVPLYTIGVLAFRAGYKKYRWQRLGAGRLIVVALGCGLLIAIVVTSGVVVTTLPFFWDQLQPAAAAGRQGAPAYAFVLRLFIGNLISTYLFVAVWQFIYISVKSLRRIRQAEFDNLKLENRLKEARLSMLSSQLNPHFLFNSLNNIRFLIHESPDKADKALTALSELLRYSLQSGRRDKVPLGVELDIVERYIEVVELQLEGRLQFESSVPEHLHHCLLPPMSLQLLVENAVKHGFENRADDGVLSVSADSDPSRMILRVCNPLPAQAGSAQRSTGTGLNNIEQRLHLLYGQAGGLSIAADKERYCVELTVPAEVRP